MIAFCRSLALIEMTMLSISGLWTTQSPSRYLSSIAAILLAMPSSKFLDRTCTAYLGTSSNASPIVKARLSAFDYNFDSKFEQYTCEQRSIRPSVLRIQLGHLSSRPVQQWVVSLVQLLHGVGGFCHPLMKEIPSLAGLLSCTFIHLAGLYHQWRLKSLEDDNIH